MIYKQEQVNLHTHSFYCGHGTGQLCEFVDAACEKGQLKVLGFSEHIPTPFNNYPSRMQYEMLKTYISDVRLLKRQTKDIEILLGGECDWNPDFVQFYKDELLGKEQFAYLLGSIHFMHDPSDGVLRYIGSIKDTSSLLKMYCKSYIEMLESGLFVLGCHPDVFAAGITDWNEDAKAVSKDIIQAAKALNIPLELNGYGFRKPLKETSNGPRYIYPIREFWEMALDEKISICFNTDAHHVAHLHAADNVKPFVEELGIKFVDWSLNENSKINYLPTSTDNSL